MYGGLGWTLGCEAGLQKVASAVQMSCAKLQAWQPQQTVVLAKVYD